MFFTLEKIENHLSEIQDTIYTETKDITEFKYEETEFGEEEKDAHKPDFDDSNWSDFNVGEQWGGYDKGAWFRTTVSIPENWEKQRVVLQFLVGPRDGGGSTAETLLYVNGEPLQGIDIWHEEAWLPPEHLENDVIHIALKAWSSVLEVPKKRRFKLARMAIVDEPTEEYYFLADTMLKAIKELDENDIHRVKMTEALNDSIKTVDFLKPMSSNYYDSIRKALSILKDFLKEMDKYNELKPKVTAVGHSHIDMAWLWRLVHSREKASRTFSTVLHLMRQYPDYRYVHTSPQLYKYLKEDYPQIYEQIKDKIKTGEWEITGGTWIEPDTNIPNGESLIRQLLFGKRFMRDEFDVDTKILWLPDVFGYSWALPQIMKKSGIETFMTTKISWSQYNRFPNDTFDWVGIDGTEILTHFITTPETNATQYTYNGMMEPHSVKGVWDQYKQKDVNDELLIAFGWGDGGGGPTKEMLEAAKAMENLPGIPNVEMDTSENYFEGLRDRVKEKDLPKWDGELYLEYHRGTYTSQAALKRANRKVEFLYHNAEWLNVLAKILDPDVNYAHETLNDGWEKILLNQFHDVLPGSSIRQVNEDARKDYALAHSMGEKVLNDSLEIIKENITVNEDSITVFNTNSFDSSGIIELPINDYLKEEYTIEDEEGNPVRSQINKIDDKNILFIEVDTIPGYSYKTYKLIEEPKYKSELVVEPDYLENDFYEIQLNEQGQITSIYDKEKEKEILAPGERANVLQVFEDKPMDFDAWDIDIYYSEKMQEISNLTAVDVVEDGPVRGTLRLQWEFSDTTIVQYMSVYNDSRRIDFKTEADWNEKQTLLKVAFPVDIRSTRATYDIQFGTIERPTHWNTSWDYAMFEVPGQKWVDLSEGNYGVALLNDCKYGYDVKGNVMRQTLIKSAIEPDETAEQGKHEFTYSLFPHSGDWREGKVVEEGYKLNNPLFAIEQPANGNSKKSSDYQFVSVDSDHVIIETIKKAEDEDAVIIRLYETEQSGEENLVMKLDKDIRYVTESNLMEEEEQDIPFSKNSIKFDITPYEIKTFKIRFD